ncbi:MAG: SusC/RagA family TonB-linked outer membrane protein [Saprospiraceae bacterium]
MCKRFTKILFLVVSICFSTGLIAQTRTISGTIVDESNEPLIGANVLVEGTSIGTSTDFDGKFLLEVSNSVAAIEISYIGFQTTLIALTEASEYSIVLKESVSLDEVVVTALGVERSEKALGYSVQKLGASQIAAVKPTNLVNAMAGKVSGVYITGGAAGPTASANINIRGAASLLGNNQPLFIVNGIPITNDLFSFDDGLNGSTTIDFGNAAQIVNPDDIASINILKGPAASALYGSRAADGVILIETKTGKDSEGWGVQINSTTTVEDILKLPDYQNEYGFGGDGKYSYQNGSNYIGSNEYYEAYGENWGPRMNGQLIKQFNSNGEPVPFTPAEDNIRDFFRTGVTAINNIAITNATETGDSRLSFTNLNRRGIVPNTNLNRNTFTASIGKELLDGKLTTRMNAMYVNSSSDNVPNAGYDESSSVMYGWLWYPRQVEINDLKDYWEPGQEGRNQRYVENLWVNNPWFIANENTNAFNSNRLMGNFQVNYDISNRFNIRFRYGADVVNEGRQFRRAPSTKGVLQGSYREDEISFSETNTEILLGYNTDRNNDLVIDFKAGGNLMRQNANYLIANNPQLKFFGTSESIYTLSNARSNVLVESQKTRTGINSLFALGTFAYKNFLYVDATYRHDWNSTLVNPVIGIDNSEFDFGYPSVSASFIASELMDLTPGRALSFLKFKAAYAEVGNGAPPYAFGNTFTPQASFGSNSVFTTGNTIADTDLTNERTTALEFGVDLRMFGNKLSLDATYYNMLSFNQVIFLPIAKTSGYDFNLTNGGEIRNSGVELLLSGRIIDKPNFSWDATLNLGHNRAVVESLPEVIESGRYSIIADVFPGDEGGADLEYVAEQGELLGQLYGLGFERGPDGRIIHVDGLPLLTKEKVSAGSFQPDVRLGLFNEFSIGQINVGFLVDGQIGGKIYSRSHALYNTGGAITNNDDPLLDLSTLEGRRVHSVSYDAAGEPVYTLESEGGVVGPGWNWVDANEDGIIADSELSENDVVVQPGGAGYTGYFYNYYGNGFNRDNIEAATYDATYFKLRELSIGYSIPSEKLEGSGVSGLRFSLVGRNLLLWSNVPTIDPETFSIRNGIFVNGFESTQLPSTRSIGLSVSAQF